MQNFMEVSEQKVHELQVRFNKLPDIFNRYDTAQTELELSDDIDQTADRELFETQYYQVEARFCELLHPVMDSIQMPEEPSPHSSQSGRSNATPQSHIRLPTIALPIFEGETRNWLSYRDTFEALIVNTTLTSVQKFHYLIASLRNEAKDLISNLQITHENFSVAWNLITQRYNNARLIAMMHARQLVNMPQVRKGDASSLRKLTNHVTSNLNAFQALEVNVPIQDLMLNHLMLATVDSETQKEWELITAPRADIPSTTELVTFLESRCQALELLQTVQSAEVQLITSRASRASHTTGIKASKPSRTYVATQMQCSLCHGSYRLFICDQFLKMSVRQRLDHIKETRRCFNCLQLNTKSHSCSKYRCRQCNARHHTLLHFDKQYQQYDVRSRNNNSPTTNNKLTADIQGNPPQKLALIVHSRANPRIKHC
jgi:hypothetical protein